MSWALRRRLDLEDKVEFGDPLTYWLTLRRGLGFSTLLAPRGAVDEYFDGFAFIFLCFFRSVVRSEVE